MVGLAPAWTSVTADGWVTVYQCNVRKWSNLTDWEDDLVTICQLQGWLQKHVIGQGLRLVVPFLNQSISQGWLRLVKGWLRIGSTYGFTRFLHFNWPRWARLLRPILVQDNRGFEGDEEAWQQLPVHEGMHQATVNQSTEAETRTTRTTMMVFFFNVLPFVATIIQLVYNKHARKPLQMIVQKELSWIFSCNKSHDSRIQ